MHNEMKQWIIINNNHNRNKCTVSSLLEETRLHAISLGFPEISRFIHKRYGSALFTTHGKLQGALKKVSTSIIIDSNDIIVIIIIIIIIIN